MQGVITDEERLEEASAWVVRLGAAEPEDLLAFDAWLEASAANREAYDQALAVWNAYGAAAPQILAEIDRQALASRRPIARRAPWMVAGGLAAAAAVGAIMVALPRAPTVAPAQVYATGIGERRTEQLADGSRIDLNAASKLLVSYSPRERRVRLDEGEAVFDVTHDPSRPFIIQAGDRQVRVVGTQFDVRRRDAKLSVTVARGLVEVRPADGASGHGYRLQPGQRLDHQDGDLAVTLSAATPADVLAWREGRLVFQDRPLGEVVAELNRQFTRPIRLEDPALAAKRVSGVLVLDHEDAVVRRMALLAPVTPVTSGGAIVLRSEARD